MTADAAAALGAVGLADLIAGFQRLGLDGRGVAVHSSLRAFGSVSGGAPAVIEALRRVCGQVLMPAFCFESNCPPPPGDRPAQNGCDYAYYDNWQRPLVPWSRERAPVDRTMGLISRTFAAQAATIRTDHPWHSWSGAGAGITALLEPHPVTTTNLPLERLADADGHVVLIGVGLTSCTAVHVAEERAGRRPFIRWSVDPSGSVRRVRVAGCSKGFARLDPYGDDLFRTTSVGAAGVRAVSLRALIARLADVISDQPELTVCSPQCLRCRDSARGGPAE